MAFTNKLFANEATLNATQLKANSMVSKMKINREYLISKHTAEELNTYVSFDPFPTFNDLFAPVYEAGKKGEETKDVTPDRQVEGVTTGGSGTLGVRSIFNKAGAVFIGSKVEDMGTNPTRHIITNKASEFRISNNVPLMDNRETRKAIRANSGCTVKELVEASQNGVLGRETYSYSDFMYCKYLGRISNNYMITLRRFPYPVDDFISSIGEGDTRKDKSYQSYNTESLGCLVTWMGTPGNELQNILKYTVTMPFKEENAQQENSGIDADANKGVFNELAAMFDSTYRQQYIDGSAGANANAFFNRFFPVSKATGLGGLGDAPYPASSWNANLDRTKLYGPVDVIKKTYMRGSDGLDFQQNITIEFDYELRSYNGINTRQAMLDLLSNILNVTYSTGTFWGGGFRGGGAHQNNIFTNLNIFKRNTRGFAGFTDAFAKDYTNLAGLAKNEIEKNGGVLETLKKVANTLGGMLVAGALNQFGRPHKVFTNSILSPAPVGFWHLTIGNPHHPIMSMGNMILKSATIQHYGPLGIDDFPTGLKVTCELTRGKSRDIRDIEKLYMHGNDRIYTSMGPKIFDMYEHSREYRLSNGTTEGVSSHSDGSPETEAVGEPTKQLNASMSKVIQKYFGHTDTYSIMVASMEQENGAHMKPKKGTAGGDSSVQGNKAK